jgi:hypothetical protein
MPKLPHDDRPYGERGYESLQLRERLEEAAHRSRHDGHKVGGREHECRRQIVAELEGNFSLRSERAEGSAHVQLCHRWLAHNEMLSSEKALNCWMPKNRMTAPDEPVEGLRRE